VGTGDSANGVAALAARYSEAFSAYLADGSESALGAAYDLGREAVAAQLSVLDLAEAHHAALRKADVHDERGLLAAADFLRESLSMFETVHRGYIEVQEVARIEHAHVEQLRALADASVAINASLTVEEIHMPAPSILPLINAVGLALAIVSLTLNWYLVAFGLIVFAVTTIRWIRDVRRDIADLPLDHSHH
jgi:type IV secretory pathway TrbD component